MLNHLGIKGQQETGAASSAGMLGTAAYQDVKPRTPGVTMALGHLERAVENLETLISELPAKLTAVLHADVSTKQAGCVEPAPDKPYCQLSQAISDVQRRVDSMAAVLIDIRNRLEI